MPQTYFICYDAETLKKTIKISAGISPPFSSLSLSFSFSPFISYFGPESDEWPLCHHQIEMFKLFPNLRRSNSAQTYKLFDVVS